MKRKKEKVELEDLPETEDAVSDLLEAVTLHTQAEAAADADVFEIYQHRLHGRLHENPVQFKERFLKGYKVLLDDMKKGQ